jgi:uncharacterized membrane protein YdjX (TVP38/TMEM64 family)
MSKRAWAIVKLLTAIAAVVAVAVWMRNSEFAQEFRTVESARRYVESFRPFDKPGFVLVYAVGALVLPGSLLSFVGAILFGVWWGTLLVWIGATLGSIAPYFVARFIGRSAIESSLGEDDRTLQRFDSWLAERGFAGLLLVRFLPIFPYFFVNYACGLLGIRFRDYLIATAVGILPGTFVYLYMFANVGEAVLKDGLKWSYLSDQNVLIPIATFLLFIVAGRGLAVRFGNSATPSVERDRSEST